VEWSDMAVTGSVGTVGAAIRAIATPYRYGVVSVSDVAGAPQAWTISGDVGCTADEPTVVGEG
jgi:hypothetical protein